MRAGVDFALTDDLFGRISGVYKHQNGYVDQLDFGCVYPAGGSATYTANDGTTQVVNPAGGIPRVRPEGSCRVDRLGEIGYQAIRGALRYNPIGRARYQPDRRVHPRRAQRRGRSARRDRGQSTTRTPTSAR